MKKPPDILKARANYVKQKVRAAKSTAAAVRKLSAELFLSEQTIYKDLSKPL